MIELIKEFYTTIFLFLSGSCIWFLYYKSKSPYYTEFLYTTGENEDEDFPSEKMKDLYIELNEEARKAKYIKYSPDKLVRGQFGKFGKLGSPYPTEYVLLSDRMLDREPFEGYAYLLKRPTISCGGFWRETGERNDNYKVLEMEDIDEAKALERYNKFLSVWKK